MEPLRRLLTRPSRSFEALWLFGENRRLTMLSIMMPFLTVDDAQCTEPAPLTMVALANINVIAFPTDLSTASCRQDAREMKRAPASSDSRRSFHLIRWGRSALRRCRT